MLRMRDETARKQFGLAVRYLRQKRGISQHALAKSARLNRTYLSGVETGQRNPTLQTITRLAEALGVPVAAFFRSQRLTSNPRRSRRISTERARG